MYILYTALAAGVVWLSIKASDYMDMLEKATKLSGAFIGGVLLSAVTSLPELLTSISGAILLGKPALCIGNVLGSNLFNMAALSAVVLVLFGIYSKSGIASSHFKISLVVIAMYAVLLLRLFDAFGAPETVFTLVIIALYVLGVRIMAGSGGEEKTGEAELTARQIITRFAFVAAGIVALSVAVTYTTDAISLRLGIGSGLAGALFLGVATSLPELSSTVRLFRIGNADIAVGNIVGSNLFNFVILALTDILYTGKGGVYVFSDPQTVALLIYGTAAAAAMTAMLSAENRIVKIICPVVMLACYFAFLAS